MKRLKSKFLFAALVSSTLGIILLAITFFIQNKIYELTVLDATTIDLSQDSFFETYLNINQSERYMIWIQFDDINDNQKLACKIGVNFSSYTCTAMESRLDISWELENADGTIIEGSSMDYPWGDASNKEIHRQIGQFFAEEGSIYQFKMYVNKDASEFAIFNPKIEIGVHPLDYQGDFFWGGILIYSSCSLIGLAVILTIVGCIFKKARELVPQ